MSDTHIWDALVKRLENFGDPHVKVGILASGKANETESSGITMAELGTIHEFGAPGANIPERSFIRQTFKLKQDEVIKVTETLAKNIVEKDMTLSKALDLLGAKGAAWIQDTIVKQLVTPKLEDSEAGKRTIERKGSSSTLIDTGLLKNAMTWEVHDK